MQTYTIAAAPDKNGWFVKTAGGTKVFPSVGVTSYEACERWIQDYTIVAALDKNGWWVKTVGGNKIFPSVGVASYEACERWIQDNSPAIRDEDQAVEVPKMDGTIRMQEQDRSSIERWSETDEITWIEYQIFDNVGRLKYLDPNHPIVLAIRTMLDMYPHIDKPECAYRPTVCELSGEHDGDCVTRTGGQDHEREKITAKAGEGWRPRQERFRGGGF